MVVITKNILKGIVPPENFSTTESKIDSFAAAYGTILYFDDTQIIKQMQEQYALYADNFPVWGQQANGMMQFALWSALSELGLGVNLQHYNPLIDEEIKKAFQVPESWKLIAQMPFGEAVNQPDPIQKKSVDERVLLARARTSSATTANPLSISPARAASIAALRANRLVCSEMARITSRILLILSLLAAT